MGFFTKKKPTADDLQGGKDPLKKHPEPSAPKQDSSLDTDSKDKGAITKNITAPHDSAPPDAAPPDGAPPAAATPAAAPPAAAPPAPLPQNGSIFCNLFPTQTIDQPLPDLTEREQRAYRQLQRLEHVMDDFIRIPCTQTRIGLDPIIGFFVPVVGDMASVAVSIIFVSRAAPTLSRYTVARMLVNVGIDGLVGCVPLVGDLFDFGFSANTRNLAIFEDHMKRGGQARKEMDQKWVLRIVIVFVLITTMIFVGTTALIVLFIMWLIGKPQQ